MSGQGFQFTPGGLATISDDGDDYAIIPANPAMFKGPDQTVSIPVAKRASAPLTKPKALDVLKLAKKSLREMNREIARLVKLTKARDELQRLVDAAEQKPRAIVRDIAAKRG